LSTLTALFICCAGIVSSALTLSMVSANAGPSAATTLFLTWPPSIAWYESSIETGLARVLA
jgi:hypothetical protein